MARKEEFYFTSSCGTTKIHAVRYIPEGNITAILQINHGMVEYIERYEDFALFMASKGFLVTGHDHLGHGKSMISKEKMG
jgi:alpha-beta hydrolase superfamily lysophospholipase